VESYKIKVKEAKMENRISEIQHNGKKIIYGDYSGLKLNDSLEVIGQQENMSLNSTDKNILHLLNFTDSKMNTESKERANAMLARLNEKGYNVKTACFGIGNLQRIIAGAVQKNMYFAKNIADAKDWLVSD
jgi:hypothetical protein